jgi:flavin-dependent dehydrogenase
MKFDVVIVGGGPAGCASAIALRKEGISVAVVSHSKIRDRATETATFRLKGLLLELGAEEALGTCEPCYGVTSKWGMESFATRPSILNPYGDAYFIHRNEFDTVLARKAKAADVIWYDDCVIDVRLSRTVFVTSKKQVFECKRLVIATGSPISSARITGQKLGKQERLVCVWSCIRNSLSERMLYTEPTDIGWWYMCPGRGDVTYACLMTRPPIARDLKLTRAPAWTKEFHRTEISRMLKLNGQLPSVHVATVSSIKLPKRSGSSWVAVGDAAMTFDPIGSCGTLLALDSGVRAAAAIANFGSGGEQLLENYEKWGSDVFDAFCKQRELLYNQERLRRRTYFWQN